MTTNKLFNNIGRLLIAFMLAANAHAGKTDIASSPLVTSSTSSVLPNLLFVLDDSGSMSWDFMPDWANSNDTSLFANADYNGIAYNPAITYTPPTSYNTDGTLNTTRYPSQASPWTSVKNDAYGVQSTGTSNLVGNAYYYTFMPGEYCTTTSLRTCVAASAPSTSYPYPAKLRWCSDAALTDCQAVRIETGSPLYTYSRTPGQVYSAAATLTILGSSTTSVSSIKVNGKEILSGTTNGSGTANTVASRIVSSINNCTGGINGNCQIAGYSASRSGSTVTILAPASLGAITYTPVIAQSGSMTISPTAFKGGGTVPGSNVRTNISSGTSSYPYPGTAAKASSRTDCTGTTCTYTEEMTNYANWWAYYHTRMQMMKTSASNAFASLSAKYRVGYMSINNNTSNDFLNLSAFDPAQRSAWYTKLTSAIPYNSTPLRTALTKAGRLYAGKLNGTTLNGSTVVDPMQYSCQQNFTLLSTDGYWNEADPGGYQLNGTTAVGNQDGNDERPYSDGAIPGTTTKTDTTTTKITTTTTSTTPITVVTTTPYTYSTSTNTTYTLNGVPSTDTLRTQTVTNGMTSTVPWTSTGTLTSSTKGGSGGGVTCTSSQYLTTVQSQSYTQLNTGITGTTRTDTPYTYTSTGTRVDTATTNSSYTATSTRTDTATTTSTSTTSSIETVVTTNGTVTSDTTSAGPTTTTGPTTNTSTGTTATTNGPVTTSSATTITGATSYSARPAGAVAGTPVTVSGYPTYTSGTKGTVPNGTGTNVTWTPTGTITGSCGTTKGSGSTVYSSITAGTATTPTGGSTASPTVVSTTSTYGAPASVTSTTAAPTSTAPVAGTASSTSTNGATTTTSSAGSPVVTTTSNTVVTAPSGGTSNTLADVAEYYYVTDLRTATLGNDTGALGTDVAFNNVPKSGKDDAASWQHMTTFTLGLGASGYMLYSPSYTSATSGDYFDVKNGTPANPSAGVCTWQASGETCNWPTPISNEQTTIDDLWHTAVNGRGTYASASNPASLSTALSNALASLSARTGDSAAATTSNPNVATGDNFVFSSTFTSVEWSGEVIRQQLDLTTGVVSAATDWKAQAKLDANTSRNIYTYAPAGTNRLKTFDWNSLTAAEQAYFTAPYISALSQFCATGTTCLSAANQTAASGATLVNFLRGDNTYAGDVTDLSKYYYKRAHVLGDVVDSEAVYVKVPVQNYADSGYSDFKIANAARKGMVYVAANDGMLHAFDAGVESGSVNGGQELWAYVPSLVLPNLYKLADKNYASQHQYFVDGTPTASDICPKAPGATCNSSEWKTILVGGLNGGGRGYYALDITDPATPKALWEFTYDTSKGAGYVSDANLGYSFGKPEITKLKDGTWVVLVTSGYNNVSPGDGQGRLYVLNAATGAIIRSIPTGVGSDTATIAGICSTAPCPSGLAQIRTWSDNSMRDNTGARVYGGDLFGNLWRFDINNDIGAAGYDAQLLATLRGPAGNVQPITAKPELGNVDGNAIVYVGTGRYLGASDLADTGAQTIYAVKDALGSTGYGNPRAAANQFVQQFLTVTTCPAGSPPTVCTTGQSVRTSTSNVVNLSVNNGWFVDLPESGERANTDPQLALGILAFNTNVPVANACTAGGYSIGYAFDYRTGGAVASSTTKVVGTMLGNAIANRQVILRLPNNTIVGLTQLGDSTKVTKNLGTPPGINPTKRVSWRELVNEQ